MSNWGSFDFSAFEQFRGNLQEMERAFPDFLRDCLLELANRLLAEVVPRTPVGSYDSDGWVEFTAKLPEQSVSFTAKLPQQQVHFFTKDGVEVSFVARARTKKVKFTAKAREKQVRFQAATLVGRKPGTLRQGWTIGHVEMTSSGAEIEVYNPVRYAAYVEYGHRTANHKGWVEGKFMLKLSEEALERELPAIVERELEQFFEQFLGR